MEIHVSVEDVNDNAPLCENEESVFEVQEGEPVGKDHQIIKERVHGALDACQIFNYKFYVD